MEENMGFTWLYARMKQMEEENSILRVDLEKLDDKNLFLERNNRRLKRQLKEDRKKYDELQQEYSTLELTLNEVMEKEKMGKIALKNSMIERKTLTKKLEAAELEMQEIASLREKLKKATSELHKSMRKVVEMTKTLDEELIKCTFQQEIVKELRETNEYLHMICQSRENMIQALREKNRVLADEHVELKLLIDGNTYLPLDRDSTIPNSNTESYCSVEHQTSLYNELKASGFSNTYDENSTIIRELENQVDWYDLEINTLLKQTEGAFEQLVLTYDEERFRSCLTQTVDYTECSENTKRFETFKRRIQILLDMFTVTPSKIADINIQQRTDSRTIGNPREVFNSHDHLECALNTGNGSIDASTVNQNCYEETAPVQSDVLRKDDNFTLQLSPALVRRSSQRFSTGRKVSKKTNKAMSKRNLIRRGNVSRNYFNTAQRFLKFTNINVEYLGAMTLGYRRSKSDSDLITEKKFSPFLHRSCNIVIIPLSTKKTSEPAEKKKKTISDSCTEERECKNVEETEEQNAVLNLSSWQEYKFGGTYRSLNDSTDSSICSTLSRHNSLLGLGDFSLNESCQQQQCKLRPISLAPTRLKRLPNKAPSIIEEKCINDTNTGCQSIHSNNESSRLIDDCYDKKEAISTSQQLFNFDIYASSAAYSTPIHIDLMDKNSYMCKIKTKQTSSKSRRRSSCGSLIRQFVDLDISDEINDTFITHSECHLDKNDDNEHVRSVNSMNTQSVASVSNKLIQHNIENENSEKRDISDKMQFSITTMERTEDSINAIRESIHNTSPDYENNTNGFEKSVHVNLPNMKELHDILEKMENSLEENNNILQGNDLYTPSPVKSNDLLSDVRQNSYGKQTDSSKLEIVDSEKSCAPAVSHTSKNNILIIPSWHTFFSCALVFILGYYIKNSISMWNTSAGAPCTWYSFEEILNRYFPIRNRQLRPL